MIKIIEGIVQIGDIVRENDPVKNIIVELPYKKGDNALHVLKFNFLPEENKLEIDVNEEMDEGTVFKYLYVGKILGNSPLWYASSTSSDYILTETIYNLTKMDFGEELNKKLKDIFEKFYVSIEELEPKYRYVLDLSKSGYKEKSVQDLFKEIKEDKKNENLSPNEIGKKFRKKVSKYFEGYLKKEKNIEPEEIGLYTVFIEGKPLSSYKEYVDAVIESKKPKTQKTKKAGISRGVCSICGSQDAIAFDSSKVKFKFFTTNQIIFASSLSKNNYYKNMQMCSECFSKYQAGENYISNKLSTKLTAFDVLIIPQFIHGKPISKYDLEIATDKIIDSFNTVKSYEGIERLREEIGTSLDLTDEKSYFLLNFIFYEIDSQATKILRLIKDVDPSIFERVRIALENANKDVKEILGEKYKGTITLSTVYYINPIRIKDGKAVKYRDILEIYDAILTGKNLSKKHIINNLVDGVRIIKFKKGGYNIIPEKRYIEFYLLEASMYVKFLEYMGCLKEGERLDVSQLKIDENIKTFISNMNYNEQETAMFLLGYLIGQIGNVQYKKAQKGIQDEGTPNKPILNKINFNGLDKQKIIRLTKDVFNKLNQEKILHYNEVTFYDMKRLIDSNIRNWKLNKDESLFYVLSGYSYATAIPILKEKKEVGSNVSE
ncbi:MAG: TIGR02556 family CRISPR-associated protein [Thermoanaerobacter sp.]|uniref:TIGR02556 family CRISPR-associated protein n=1 Tax=unclassified Thermoanaerobacter TaxID=2636821 RepID=UPI0000E1E1C1|nr:TIGR02556 family CRISPR-associated protein [Thermoanaerobacter sp. X514]ABY93586.1 CRISPR-associated protein, Csh1 family [Thermoanaerobacter sp. X514]